MKIAVRGFTLVGIGSCLLLAFRLFEHDAHPVEAARPHPLALLQLARLRVQQLHLRDVHLTVSVPHYLIKVQMVPQLIDW